MIVGGVAIHKWGKDTGSYTWQPVSGNRLDGGRTILFEDTEDNTSTETLTHCRPLNAVIDYMMVEID